MSLAISVTVSGSNLQLADDDSTSNFTKLGGRRRGGENSEIASPRKERAR